MGIAGINDRLGNCTTGRLRLANRPSRVDDGRAQQFSATCGHGIVNLSNGAHAKTHYISITNLCGKAIQHRISGHGFPRLEGLLACLPLLLRVRVVPAVHKQVAHLSMDRRESL
jgi:hypothetical protein